MNVFKPVFQLSSLPSHGSHVRVHLPIRHSSSSCRVPVQSLPDLSLHRIHWKSHSKSPGDSDSVGLVIGIFKKPDRYFSGQIHSRNLMLEASLFWREFKLAKHICQVTLLCPWLASLWEEPSGWPLLTWFHPLCMNLNVLLLSGMFLCVSIPPLDTPDT